MSGQWEAVLFDWDDTLCGAEPHRFVYAQTVANEFGLSLTLADVYAAFVRAGDSAAGAWDEFIVRLPEALGIPQRDADAFIERYRQRDTIRTFQLFDDVLDALGEIRSRGLRVGIITNNDDAEDRLHELRMHHLVEIVVSPRTFGVGKPDPRIFTETLAQMQIAPERGLYVGDSWDNDVVGARSAGLTPILIDRWEINPRADSTLRVTSLSHVLSVALGAATRL